METAHKATYITKYSKTSETTNAPESSVSLSTLAEQSLAGPDDDDDDDDDDE